ncbi:extracellular solute-binding protein [Streptomyces sp. NPDC008086]|uniref:extracellular solute-binding protein n=1 Tax=Streptomyces sp. NPDC008086 TaxID=3364807 RepID=UPI0036EAB020
MRSTGFRHAFAALSVCSLALAVSACGSSDDSASGKTRITVNCMPPKSAKVDRRFFEQDVAAFEKQNPDIDVVAHDAFPCQDPKTFDAKLAGGQMEDVFYTYFTDARHVVDIDQAADLTPYVKELKSYETIQQRLRDIYTVDGRIYGIPRTGYSMGLIYNRKLFQKAGLDPEKPPTTWAELRAAAEKIAGLGDGTVGYADYSAQNQGGWHFITVDGATVRNTGTVVVQAETQGAATFRDVTATGVGAAGVYNCPYPAGSGTFTVADGGGNSGWSGTWSDCSTWPQPGQGNPDPDPGRNLAKGRPTTATGSQDVYIPGKAVDGDASTYWESTNNAFPQALTVDLGSTETVRRLVLKLPPSPAWGARTQTVTVLGGTDGSTYSTVVGATGYRFDPAPGNTATVSLPAGTSLRHLRLSVSANTGWPAGQFSEVEVYPTS